MTETSFSAPQLAQFSPLQLAFVGDSLYSLLVRARLLREGLSPKRLHAGAVQHVNCAAQAKALAAIMDQLNEAEAEIVRRGRNAHSHHQFPKSGTCADYSASTALECLFGYLYLTAQQQRIAQLFETAFMSFGG